RSSRWSSPACSMRTSTRSSRCRSRRRWKSSCARVSRAFLRPRATRSRSLLRWELRRNRSSSAPAWRRPCSTRRLPNRWWSATASAAELTELALRLTPADEVGERHRRALAAARANRAAGEWTRARTIASDLLDESGLDLLRADVLILLAELEGLDRAVALLEE